MSLGATEIEAAREPFSGLGDTTARRALAALDAAA